MNAPHVASLIRRAAVEALKNQTLAEDRVFGTRYQPLEEAELPAILVFALEEQVIELNIDDDQLRTLELVVLAEIASNENFDDLADSIAVEIEATITDQSIPEARSVSLRRRKLMVDPKPDTKRASMEMTYEVQYITRRGNPTLPRF